MPSELPAQKFHTVTVADEILVAPSGYTLRIMCMAPGILAKKWAGFGAYLSRDSVLVLLRDIPQIRIVEAPDTAPYVDVQDYLEVIYVEAMGITAYREVTRRLAGKASILVEAYHVDDLEWYEAELIDRLLERAQALANSELMARGKTVGNIKDYGEPKEAGKSTEQEPQTGSLGALLSQKFEDANYRGYFFNDEEELVVKKELVVRFRVGE